MTSVRPHRSPQRGRPDSGPQTHYAVLGVPPASSHEKIHDTYLRLARMYHPDVNPQGAERFKAIALAWGVLRDEKLRRDYDMRLLLEGRFSCPDCGGKGLRAAFVGRKFVKEALCESCKGTGENSAQ